MEHIGNKLGDDKYRFEIMEHSCNRSIAENPEKEGDFMQDGFLHCGTCKEAKREYFEWHGQKFLTSRKCKCIRDAEAEEEKRKKYEERMAKVARLRSQSLMDEMFYKATFKNFDVTDDNRTVYNACVAELEDKIESGQLVDTTPYIVEIKNEIPFKFKVIKPTLHRRNVEMCGSRESAEARIKKLQEVKL